MYSRKSRYPGAALALIMGVLLGGSISAHALNGDIWIAPCENCSAMTDFGNLALQDAQTAVRTGLYLVTSRNYPKTGYVRVTGSPGWVCDQWGECEYKLRNAYAQLIDESGTAVAVPADLDRIDEAIHATSRAQRVPPLPIRPDDVDSFIGSMDEFVTRAINQALLVAGINNGYLPVDTKVIAVFADGTKAEFRKQCQCTDMWVWTGKAWNSSGRMINRDGSLRSEQNTSGLGGGTAGTQFIAAGTGSDVRYHFTGDMRCRVSTRIDINGVEVSYYFTYLPC